MLVLVLKSIPQNDMFNQRNKQRSVVFKIHCWFGGRMILPFINSICEREKDHLPNILERMKNRKVILDRCGRMTIGSLLLSGNRCWERLKVRGEGDNRG